jgi:SPP1 family predicted phage head-tail adaptor
MNEYPHTVIVQTFIKIDDGAGGFTENWVDLKTIEAHIQPISGNEYYHAQKIQNPVEVDVYTPYDSDIQSTFRLKNGNEVLNIKAVLNQGGMNEILLLKCSVD